MEVKTAICNVDVAALRRLLVEDRSRSNELIRWGKNDCVLTHPLHYLSDMTPARTWIFSGKRIVTWLEIEEVRGDAAMLAALH